jgi:hypothetical protein
MTATTKLLATYKTHSWKSTKADKDYVLLSVELTEKGATKAGHDNSTGWLPLFVWDTELADKFIGLPYDSTIKIEIKAGKYPSLVKVHSVESSDSGVLGAQPPHPAKPHWENHFGFVDDQIPF